MKNIHEKLYLYLRIWFSCIFLISRYFILKKILFLIDAICIFVKIAKIKATIDYLSSTKGTLMHRVLKYILLSRFISIYIYASGVDYVYGLFSYTWHTCSWQISKKASVDQSENRDFLYSYFTIHSPSL